MNIKSKELSLVELCERLGSDSRVDYAVPARDIAACIRGNGDELNTHIAFGDDSFDMTDHATSQFHSRLAPGFKTYAEHLKENRMFQSYQENIASLVERDNRTFRVRTLQNNGMDDRMARAIVSDRFKPIDDDVIFGTALPLIDNNRFQGIGGNKTDTRTVCKFIERDASVSIQSGARTRNFHLGFILNNSEVGAGSASFSMFMSDSFCTNGCIFSKEMLANISYRHIGSRIDVRNGIIPESRLARAEMNSIRRMIGEATTQAMSLGGMEKIKHALQQSVDRKIERDATEFVEDLGKTVGLTKKEVEQIPLYANQDEWNQLGIQAAITALAQDKPYERRLELEIIGGKVLMMNDRAWQRLAS